MRFEWDERKNKMNQKKHYDFSKGEKGKFFVSEENIELPIYLNDNNRNYYLELKIYQYLS